MKPPFEIIEPGPVRLIYGYSANGRPWFTKKCLRCERAIRGVGFTNGSGKPAGRLSSTSVGCTLKYNSTKASAASRGWGYAGWRKTRIAALCRVCAGSIFSISRIKAYGVIHSCLTTRAAFKCFAKELFRRDGLDPTLFDRTFEPVYFDGNPEDLK
jgi:hypothetical protein